MPRAIDNAWITEVQRVHGSTAFAWLFDIPLLVNESLHVRAAITPYPSSLVVGPTTFQPWPSAIGPIEDDIDGAHAQLAITLSNHGRVLMPYFRPGEQIEGPIGRNVTVRLVKVDQLSVAWMYAWRIAAIGADESRVTLRLEELNWWDLDVPQDRFSADQCRFLFGDQSTGCPYIISPTAAYRSCGGTLADCIARGEDMRNRNLGDVLPAQWGGFPGMAEQ